MCLTYRANGEKGNLMKTVKYNKDEQGSKVFYRKLRDARKAAAENGEEYTVVRGIDNYYISMFLGYAVEKR